MRSGSDQESCGGRATSRTTSIIGAFQGRRRLAPMLALTQKIKSSTVCRHGATPFRGLKPDRGWLTATADECAAAIHRSFWGVRSWTVASISLSGPAACLP